MAGFPLTRTVAPKCALKFHEKRGQPTMLGETKPSILVVEDENVVAMDLVASLEKLRYPVAGVVASGEEAVAVAERKAPGLVLMDIHLRGEMDGIRAAEQIQERFFIPVVYLTAYSDEATLDRARVTYPFGYILKPFEDREIEVAIQTALYRHKMEQAIRAGEKRLEAVLTSIGDAVIATDPATRIMFLNRAAETLLGWKSERARGRLLADVLKMAPQGDGVFRLTGAGPESVLGELVQSPIRDPSGNPTGYVTVARDISQRLRAQEAHERELLERAARAAAERDHQRARLKSEISLLLGDVTRSADMLSHLRRVAELIVGGFATWCVLDLEDGDGKRHVVAHKDPTKAAILEALLQQWPPDSDLPHGRYALIRSGQADWTDIISDEALAQLARDPEQLAALRSLGMSSFLCVQLRVRARIIGALTLVSSEATRSYDQGDVSFIQQVADRIALALENARLYREARDAEAAAERLYKAEQRARTEAESLFRIAAALSEAQLDLETIVQRVTDEVTELVGAKFGAFFYNVAGEQGGQHMVYTLSGARREVFEQFELAGIAPLFSPTLAGQRVLRSDVPEDRGDGRMAPHEGTSEGHLPAMS